VGVNLSFVPQLDDSIWLKSAEGDKGMEFL
jgi:hypothetical protein